MPPCKKELGLYHRKNAEFRAMMLRCVMGEGHGGDCQFHVWSDAANAATGKAGVMQTIKAKPYEKELPPEAKAEGV